MWFSLHVAVCWCSAKQILNSSLCLSHCVLLKLLDSFTQITSEIYKNKKHQSFLWFLVVSSFVVGLLPVKL